MYLRTYFKEPNFYQTFDTYSKYESGKIYEMRLEDIKKLGFTNEEFDRRELSNIRGKSGTLILENDIMITNAAETIRNEITKYNTNQRNIEVCSLHPSKLSIIQDALKETGENYNNKFFHIKNIIIDSLFQNIEQVRFMINKCFANYTGLNYFIFSSGKFIEIINNELLNHMDKYPIRNPYYKNFNELTFTLMKNTFYEVEFKFVNGNRVIDYIHIMKYQDDINQLIYTKKLKWRNDDAIVLSETTKENENVWAS